MSDTLRRDSLAVCKRSFQVTIKNYFLSKNQNNDSAIHSNYEIHLQVFNITVQQIFNFEKIQELGVHLVNSVALIPNLDLFFTYTSGFSEKAYLILTK